MLQYSNRAVTYCEICHVWEIATAWIIMIITVRLHGLKNNPWTFKRNVQKYNISEGYDWWPLCDNAPN